MIAASIADCNAVLIAMGCFFVVGVPSTSALFFFRVKAVYYHNKFITWFFGFLLFALFALSFLVPVTRRGTHIGTTQRCINIETQHYASAPVLLNAIMDTLIFIAISFRVISYSLVGNTFGARMRSFFRGDGLSIIAKSVLQGGQLYYLSVISDFLPRLVIGKC
jgi:hypothetical protein